MTRAWIEAPAGWGPRRQLAARLRRLGYRIREVGAGELWRLELS
jgi:hypothetical protein